MCEKDHLLNRKRKHQFSRTLCFPVCTSDLVIDPSQHWLGLLGVAIRGTGNILGTDVFATSWKDVGLLPVIGVTGLFRLRKSGSQDNKISIDGKYVLAKVVTTKLGNISIATLCIGCVYLVLDHRTTDREVTALV